MADKPYEFTKDEVYTAVITYPAPIHLLTAPQWQILMRSGFSGILGGAGMGAIVASGISAASTWMETGGVSIRERWQVVISVVAAAMLWVLGCFLDRKRRRVKKSIDNKLLSDRELGI
jgi:hypothetical protein